MDTLRINKNALPAMIQARKADRPANAGNFSAAADPALASLHQGSNHLNPLGGVARKQDPVVSLYKKIGHALQDMEDAKTAGSGRETEKSTEAGKETLSAAERQQLQKELEYFAGQDRRFREVLGQFESMFISMIMREGRKTLNPDNDILGNGAGQKWFTEELDNAYALLGSQTRGGSGIKQNMYREYVSHVRAEAGLKKTPPELKDFDRSIQQYSNMLDEIA